MRRMYQIQRPRGRAAYSMNQAELSNRAHLYQSVRSNLKVFTGWTFWCKHTRLKIRCVAQRLLGHTAPPQAKKVLVVSTNQDETIDTSAGTTSSDHAGRKPVPKAMRNPHASREQETVWQVIPSFKAHEQ